MAEQTALETSLLSGHSFIPRQPDSHMLTSPKLFHLAKSVTTNYRLTNQEILLLLRNYNFATVCTTARPWTLVWVKKFPVHIAANSWVRLVIDPNVLRGPTSGILPSGFPAKTLHAFLSFPWRENFRSPVTHFISSSLKYLVNSRPIRHGNFHYAASYSLLSHLDFQVRVLSLKLGLRHTQSMFHSHRKNKERKATRVGILILATLL